MYRLNHGIHHNFRPNKDSAMMEAYFWSTKNVLEDSAE